MTDLADRRKEARELVVEFTLVYEATEGKLPGYLRDLTKHGCQVSGSKKLEPGTAVTLSIELPNDLPGVSKEELQVNATARRCNTVTETPPNYAIGFEFMTLKEGKSEIIDKLLKRHYFRRSWAH